MGRERLRRCPPVRRRDHAHLVAWSVLQRGPAPAGAACAAGGRWRGVRERAAPSAARWWATPRQLQRAKRSARRVNERGAGAQVAEVCYAKVQGCNGCVEHFKNAKFPCHDRDCLPLVFAGVRPRPRRAPPPHAPPHAPACRSLLAAVRAPARYPWALPGCPTLPEHPRAMPAAGLTAMSGLARKGLLQGAGARRRRRAPARRARARASRCMRRRRRRASSRRRNSAPGACGACLQGPPPRQASSSERHVMTLRPAPHPRALPEITLPGAPRPEF
jgi:hypothetical protein